MALGDVCSLCILHSSVLCFIICDFFSYRHHLDINMAGSGSQLPTPLLLLSTLSALLATTISLVGIRTHLRNYRMPLLQRFTVRILVMWVMLLQRLLLQAHTSRVPVYALASLISLFSLDAAYWIDVGRDLYEVGQLLRLSLSNTRFLGFRYILFL